MTEARKEEVEAEKKNRPPRSLTGYSPAFVGCAVLVGLPLLLVVDGLAFRIGVL